MLLDLKDYTGSSLLRMDAQVFQDLIIPAEVLFRRNLKLTHMGSLSQHLFNALSDRFECYSSPPCHDVKSKLLKRFCIIRLKIQSGLSKEKMRVDNVTKKKAGASYGSKSAAMRNLADGVK